ncbi:hypothetical protein ABZ078_01820 [Streptomyces sp. NPDC006385]|uniref:hypothetical protein n=1 Tax=Streptomyces sp. NPDC006385 TaxID=3156761 RepID=UPI0033AA9146
MQATDLAAEHLAHGNGTARPSCSPPARRLADAHGARCPPTPATATPTASSTVKGLDLAACRVAALVSASVGFS